MLAEVELTRQLGQRGTTDQRGTQTRHFAFTGLRKALVDEFGHQQIQQGIAKKFEPLIVWPPGAAMGQRLLQQTGIGVAMPEWRLAIRHPRQRG